jgi:hypothetical protein
LLGASCFSFQLLALPPRSLNPKFFGIWKGIAPVRQLCSGTGQNQKGDGPVSLTIERPKIEPLKNYVVLLRANWGCFAEMTTPGFIFDDEFWSAADDRMTFVRLKLEKNETISGNFRFDLNGHSLKMDFNNFKK